MRVQMRVQTLRTLQAAFPPTRPLLVALSRGLGCLGGQLAGPRVCSDLGRPRWRRGSGWMDRGSALSCLCG